LRIKFKLENMKGRNLSRDLGSVRTVFKKIVIMWSKIGSLVNKVMKLLVP
jgi:hypothetical protein